QQSVHCDPSRRHGRSLSTYRRLRSVQVVSFRHGLPPPRPPDPAPTAPFAAPVSLHAAHFPSAACAARHQRPADMASSRRFVVGISGASGASYALRLLELLLLGGHE